MLFFGFGTVQFLFCKGVAFPENAVGIALDLRMGVCHFETLFSPDAVTSFPFDADVAALEFSGSDTCGAGAQKGIKNDSVFGRTCQNDLGDQFFRFLSGMGSILRHGPKGDGQIVPEI